MEFSSIEVSWTRNARKLVDIVKLAKEAELFASQFYLSLGNNSKDRDMASFWLSMSEEENVHMVYWGKILDLVEKGGLPQIFDDEEAVIRELLTIHGKMKELLAESEKLSLKQNDALLGAFKIEFYNIHSVLLPLLRFAKPLIGLKCPYDNYESHLTCFIDAYNRYNGSVSPEMQLFEEVMRKLWSDNLRLVQQNGLDDLTGLFNRRGFAIAALPMVCQAQRDVEPVALMMIDIDHFKKVNDVLGHQTGDLVLKHVANAMRGALRGADIIARYGGEEFIVLCPGVKDSSANFAAERVRAAVESSHFDSCPVTISVGVVDAVLPAGMNANECISSLCVHADMLLLKAKAEGRNRVLFQTHTFPPEGAKTQS